MYLAALPLTEAVNTSIILSVCCCLFLCYSQNGTEKCEVDLIENGQCMAQDVERPIPGSNASTLSTASSYMENCSNGSSACSDEHLFTEQEIVRTVLYSSRENVNIVHEVFRQVSIVIIVQVLCFCFFISFISVYWSHNCWQWWQFNYQIVCLHLCMHMLNIYIYCMWISWIVWLGFFGHCRHLKIMVTIFMYMSYSHLQISCMCMFMCIKTLNLVNFKYLYAQLWVQNC